MVTKTITDYKTVEDTRSVTECDMPGCINTEEEVDVVTVAVNPKITEERHSEIKLIETYDDYYDAHDAYHEMKMQAATDILDVGIGRKISTREKNPRCSAKIDLCGSCLAELFDISLKTAEIEDVEMHSGDVNININRDGGFISSMLTGRVGSFFRHPAIFSLTVTFLSMVIIGLFLVVVHIVMTTLL